MKSKRLLSLALTVLLGLSGVGLLKGQVVKADTTAQTVGVSYQGHVQNIGWQPVVSDGAEAGTDGKGFRVEALKINLTNAPAGAHITYQAHVQNIGWQAQVEDGAEAGTDEQGLRVEAIKISLENLPGYSVEYRTHVQNVGWQPWVSDGEEAGTDGKGFRVEAIQIKIVKISNVSTTPSDNTVKYFPKLSDVPMPTNVNYNNATLSNDGTETIYVYSVLTLPSDFISDYQSLLENNGWSLYQSKSDDKGEPEEYFVKGTEMILIGYITNGNNLVIMGTIH